MIVNRLAFFCSSSQRILLFLFYLCLNQVLFAQQNTVDSLLIELKKHPQADTTRVHLLSELAYNYHTILPDSTTLLAKQAFLLSQKLNYEKGTADALKHWAIGSYLISEYKDAIDKNEQALAIYQKINDLKGCGAVLNNIAIIKHNQGEFDDALKYYQQSLDIRLKINDKVGIAGCYNNIGNTHADKGNYSEALFYLFKGLRLRETLHNPQWIANSLANISNIYFYLGKEEASLTYSSRALALQEKMGNKDGIVQALVSVGGVYHYQHKYAEALKCFWKALKISEEMGNEHSVALCLNNIGETYIDQKKFTEAKPYFEKSLALSQKSGDIESIAISHNGIAKTLLHSNNASQAIKHLLTSYQLSTSIGAKRIELETAENLALAYDKLRDYKNKAFYLQKVISYKDSLFNDELTKKLEQIEFNFILDKKQKEISLLEKDRSIQKANNDRTSLINLSMSVVLFLVVAFSLSVWISFQKIKKVNTVTLKQKDEISRQAKELQELNTLKDKTFSVLSHDLRSPVASLSGIMSLMNENMITPQEFVTVKEGMNNQLSALSLLLDNLLYWSRSQINGDNSTSKQNIDLHKIIDQNINLLNETAKQKNISLVFDSDNKNLLAAFADINHADIVIRNLISNAIKFTHPNGKIAIEVKEQGSNVLMTITDNGIGMDQSLAQKLFTNKQYSNYGTAGEKGTGLGLLLCKDFAEQNNGELGVTSKLGQGSTFYFTLPKA